MRAGPLLDSLAWRSSEAAPFRSCDSSAASNFKLASSANEAAFVDVGPASRAASAASPSISVRLPLSRRPTDEGSRGRTIGLSSALLSTMEGSSGPLAWLAEARTLGGEPPCKSALSVFIICFFSPALTCRFIRLWRGGERPSGPASGNPLLSSSAVDGGGGQMLLMGRDAFRTLVALPTLACVP
jgi:hypothetical protein